VNASEAPTQSARQRVIRLIAALAVPQRAPDGVAAGDRLIDDLGFDSVRLIELAMTLERAFGLPPQRPENLATVSIVDDVVTFALTTAKDPT
jgi:acyl carrier protein